MIPKNSTLLIWHLNPKKVFSTNLIRRILIYHLVARIAFSRFAWKVWAKEHALLFKIFRENVLFSDETTLELHPSKRVLVRRLLNTGMEKKEFIGNPKIWRKKIDALVFYCPRWSEMSPESLWNDKFDQISADFARKSSAGNVFGRKIATR